MRPGRASIAIALVAAIVIPTQAAAFRVCCCAPETSVGCSNLSSAFSATLEPLGRPFPYFRYGQPELSVCIDDVPPGDYTITQSGSCNPFGCLAISTPVKVVDQDVHTSIRRYECGGSCYFCGPPRPSAAEFGICVEALLADDVDLCSACDASRDGKVSLYELIGDVNTHLAVGDCADACVEPDNATQR